MCAKTLGKFNFGTSWFIVTLNQSNKNTRKDSCDFVQHIVGFYLLIREYQGQCGV
jgi:nicotinamide riboside transporter PnuC